ncbi:formin-like protein 21b isoform X2 [Arachis hypogaea]|uniref:formin-like protein 21b isoform X2 n=1 Tax=Arachis hypogaea TaxID=3818 RepID=UPI000DEC98DE|nr:formin-like protein 21b isoform X2 [Arachis hypogaea]
MRLRMMREKMVLVQRMIQGAMPKQLKKPRDRNYLHNTEIMLTKVKMPLPDMMAAVLAMDESILDVDQVKNLIKFCPTKEEMELLKVKINKLIILNSYILFCQGYTGDKENLEKCEQYFLELMKVPRVESKLRVFSFKIQFLSHVLADRSPGLLDFRLDLVSLEATTKDNIEDDDNED